MGARRITGSTEAAQQALAGIVEIARTSPGMKELRRRIAEYVKLKVGERPTSALLINAFRDILSRLEEGPGGLEEARSLLEKSVRSWIHRARRSVERLAKIGARRIPDDSVILTHSYSYSVLRTLEECRKAGKAIRVMVTEARPMGEGLAMAEALEARNIPVTLIVDSAARLVMKEIDLVLLGAEAIAANGAVVNKVGSSLIALAAHEARRRVFIAAGTYKFSVETVFGELVEIPVLPPETILPEASDTRQAYNAWIPLMDVTPPEYIDAIITEEGMIAPEAVPLVLRELYGSWPPRLPGLEELVERLLGDSHGDPGRG